MALDRLVLGKSAQQTPPRAALPSLNTHPDAGHLLIVAALVLLLLIGGLFVAAVAFLHEGVDVGGSDVSASVARYVEDLGPAIADGWDAAADALDHGKSMEDAKKATEEQFHASSARSYEKTLLARHKDIIAADKQPDERQREQLVKLFRAEAAAARGTR